MPHVSRNVLSLVGFAAIVATALTFDDTTAFPGWTALLPVLGTVAVIVSGENATGLWHDRVTRTRPIQTLGNISYSMYLWHWPPIIILPFALGNPLSPLDRVLILVGTVIAAWLSRRFIEVPVQRWRWTAVKTRRTFAMMAAAMMVLVAVSALQWNSYQNALAADQERVEIAQEEPCFGPAALDPDHDCTSEEKFGSPISSIPVEYASSAPECDAQSSDLMTGGLKTTTRCDFSDADPEAERVWLIGDSHAQQWAPAMFELARIRGWHLTISYLGACPMADFERYVGYGTDAISEAAAQDCRDFVRDVSDAIIDDRPSYVATSFFARAEAIDDGTRDDQIEQYSKAGPCGSDGPRSGRRSSCSLIHH